MRDWIANVVLGTLLVAIAVAYIWILAASGNMGPGNPAVDPAHEPSGQPCFTGDPGFC